ncbi:MAG: contractile injection system protein, VgrG/Pvc8 family [Salinisphaera sp.]|nr:contractile injection system protein, VgrG/Pvc8 family [Salinisphaera sp.]
MAVNIAPAYRIIANSADITATVRQRLVSLRIIDESGVHSDRFELILADHDPLNAIQLPSTGAELDVSIGYDGAARRMGLFIVDEVELSGPPRQMRISAKASPHDVTPTGITALQTQRSRSWPLNTTISAMVTAIANDHGLKPAVAAALGSIQLPHIDQTNESDINLLTRVARDHDAVAKPGGGRLVMVPRAASKSASGAFLGQTVLAPADVSSWSVLDSRRPPASSVIAVYRDHAKSKDAEVVVGSGEPTRRLPHTYASESSARRAAQAERDQSNRAGRTMRARLPGNAAFLAESRLLLTNFRPGVDGDWLLTRVTHQIDSSGYSCSLEGEVPNS